MVRQHGSHPENIQTPIYATLQAIHDVSRADEEPSEASPDAALTMSALSEQLAMALQRIAALEEDRR